VSHNIVKLEVFMIEKIYLSCGVAMFILLSHIRNRT